MKHCITFILALLCGNAFAQAPAAPTALSATVNSASQITIQWTDNSANETGFQVERNSGSGFTLIYTSLANGTSYVNTGLNPSTVYYYRVRAANASGNSVYTSQVSGKTWPAAPINFTASQVRSNSVAFTWNDVATGESGFALERSVTSPTAGFSNVATSGSNTESYINTGLSVSTTYYYRLKANSSFGSSAYTPVITVRTLSKQSEILGDFAFAYQYDERKRITAKKVPGADWLFQVYDERDRLVFTQDGVQRINLINQSQAPKWSYIKYDAFNRPVISGLYTHNTALSQAEMAQKISATNLFEARNTDATSHGYTNVVFPSSEFLTSNFEPLTITYYDDHSYNTLILQPDQTRDTRFDYKADEYSDQYKYNGTAASFPFVNGLVTATKLKVLGEESWIWSVSHYDDKYRVVQIITTNVLGGVDRVTNVYDFAGRVTKTKLVHQEGTSMSKVIEQKFSYDHAGRMTKHWHNYNSNGWILLVLNEYNAIGQLVTKKLHNTDPEPTSDASRVFKQNVDYRYNIRGWLSNINNLSVAEVGDLFGMTLNYNTPTTNGGSAQFNGNISEILWTAADNQNHSYGYTYDDMNRLVEGKYYNVNTPARNNRFNEKIWNVSQNKSGYDLNGNIKFLQRQGRTGETAGITTYGVMDNLTYTYSGNQLSKVADAAVKTEGFVDGANTDNDYTYDANGNMFKDRNKTIDAVTTTNGASRITYNHLNLVDQVTKTSGEYVKYVYDASGRKLRQVVYDAANVQQKATDYSSEFVYETIANGPAILQFINHAEGRITPKTSVEYQYHLKDHLGNVRTTFTTTPTSENTSATLEPSNSTQETANFLRTANARKVQYYAYDHTNGESPTISDGYAERLSGGVNERYGLARSVSVMPGDQVSAEVYAKYVDPVSGNRTPAINNFINQVAALIAAGTTGSGTVVDGGSFSASTSSFPFPADAANNTAGSVGGGPKAFLNWLVFDRDYNLIPSKSGFKRISATPKETGQDVAHERLFSPQITIDMAGYVYIFLSNEESSPVDVYFDDFNVTQVKSPVVQMDDYYPGGATFNSYNRENSVANKRLYQTKEFQTDLGLEQYDFGPRQYDPFIWRTTSHDPHAENYYAWSPYSWAFNNPVRYDDPSGKDPGDKVLGFAAALIDNAFGGLTNARSVAANYVDDAEDFNMGQDMGDVSSIIIGGMMVEGGTGAAIGGVTVSASGVGAVVGAPTALTGVAVAAEGVILGGSGAANLTTQKGRLEARQTDSGYSKTKHTDNRHVDRNKYPEKSKYSKPNQVDKINEKTMKKPDKTTTQNNGRVVYEKDMKRKIGTQGQTTNKVVTDPKKKKIVTSYPTN